MHRARTLCSHGRKHLIVIHFCCLFVVLFLFRTVAHGMRSVARIRSVCTEKWLRSHAKSSGEPDQYILKLMWLLAYLHIIFLFNSANRREVSAQPLGLHFGGGRRGWFGPGQTLLGYRCSQVPSTAGEREWRNVRRGGTRAMCDGWRNRSSRQSATLFNPSLFAGKTDCMAASFSHWLTLETVYKTKAI